MSQLVTHENRSPIPGWQIDSTGLVAKTRWHFSWPIFYAFAAIWNLALTQLELTKRAGTIDVFSVIGFVAAGVFALLAVRAFCTRTFVRFTERELVVENALAPWQKIRIDLAEIKAFPVVRDEAQNMSRVGVTLSSGQVVTLPIDWQPLSIATRGSSKRLWVAPEDHAAWMSRALNDMLTNARRLGHAAKKS